MSRAAPGVEEGASEERPRLASMEIGGWPGLAEDVRVPLDERCTVLVGKNGAGKSRMMEGMYLAAQCACFDQGMVDEPTPLYVRCEIMRPAASTVLYEYRLGSADRWEEDEASAHEGDPPPKRARPWYERCWTSDGAELWKVEERKVTLRGGAAAPSRPGAGLFNLDIGPHDIPAENELVAKTLCGMMVVPPGMPSSGFAQRREIIISSRRDPGGARWWWPPAPGAGRIEGLARSILSAWETDTERYDEFTAILRNLGLVNEIVVNVDPDRHPHASAKSRRDLATVLFDGVDIGLQSDGTLRVAEIVDRLLRPGLTCLLVEEPELAVHPSLLHRLLSQIEPYLLDRQLIVSTHSPYVVDWAKPQQIRIVEREQGVTKVRSFSGDTMRLVNAYLADQGTLGDFVYRHGEP